MNVKQYQSVGYSLYESLNMFVPSFINVHDVSLHVHMVAAVCRVQ